MNLDQEDKKPLPSEKEPEKKKLTRKQKKALKKAEIQDKPPPVPTPAKKTVPPPSVETSKPKSAAQKPEVVDAKLDPSPVEEIPPPKYTTWEKISPPARRKKQITTMESGFREVLGLVHSMRNNQEVLLDAFQKLPEAVDSVKKLADHSAQQSDLLKAMNESMSTGAAGEFNKTLSSMDQTTQLLLERAQRSEERLYSMLRRAQRRIAFMTLMVLLLFLGAVAAGMLIFFPEKAQTFMGKFNKQEVEKTTVITPVIATETDEIIPPVAKELPVESEISPIDQPLNNQLPVEEVESEMPEVTLPEAAPLLEEVLEEAEVVKVEVPEVLSQEEPVKIEEQPAAPSGPVAEKTDGVLPKTEEIQETVIEDLPPVKGTEKPSAPKAE
ncbi:hypothetical protein P0Y35_03765 [Kiritimatiellaeota bacterium B1221]|nr:hypothetical protein [Kiritimatiellaeota bacterium B1221]